MIVDLVQQNSWRASADVALPISNLTTNGVE